MYGFLVIFGMFFLNDVYLIDVIAELDVTFVYIGVQNVNLSVVKCGYEI